MTSSLSKQHQALFLESKQGKFVLGTNVTSSPGEGQILIKIKSTALNPVDWKIQKTGVFVEDYPAILGSDQAGDVVQVGSNVTKFKPGDKVFNQGQYNNQSASFQEYALANEINVSKIPSNITYDQAATLPVALTCAYIGLFQVLPYGAGAPNPVATPGTNKGNSLLVFGGATSVGQYAIQLAKIAGFSPIITTASLKHTKHLKALGATDVLDRNLSFSSLKEEIDKITSKPIIYVFDTVSNAQTQQNGHDLLAPGGNLILVLQPNLTEPEDKKLNVIPVWGGSYLPHNLELFAKFYKKLPEWLENGTIQTSKVEIVPGGLGGIADGLLRLENGQVSGVKLVVHPEETVTQE